jgi:DNA-binding response OmpR family regulator
MRVLSSQQARVLVVDDIPENRILLCRYFGIRGFMMVQAESGAAALTMIQRQSFDAVLLDIMMPGMDGIEVLKRIRALHSPLNLPVIMVSGKSARMDISLAMDLGANDYLTKPIDLAAAVIRVRGHLAPKHAAHVSVH